MAQGAGLDAGRLTKIRLNFFNLLLAKNAKIGTTQFGSVSSGI
jgi:hypothetical protein